jgi:hypothetical protein
MVNAQSWVHTQMVINMHGPSKQEVDNSESLYFAALCERHICDLQQHNILDMQNYHLMLYVPSFSHQQNLAKNKNDRKVGVWQSDL